MKIYLKYPRPDIIELCVDTKMCSPPFQHQVREPFEPDAQPSVYSKPCGEHNIQLGAIWRPHQRIAAS